MRVRLSQLAQSDMRAIGDRISREVSPRRAREFILDLREQCLGLSRMPERFALLDGFENTGVRRRVCGNYLIVYRIKTSDVEILRIFHGTMEYEKLLSMDTRLKDDLH